MLLFGFTFSLDLLTFYFAKPVIISTHNHQNLSQIFKHCAFYFDRILINSTVVENVNYHLKFHRGCLMFTSSDHCVHTIFLSWYINFRECMIFIQNTECLKIKCQNLERVGDRWTKKKSPWEIVSFCFVLKKITK